MIQATKKNALLLVLSSVIILDMLPGELISELTCKCAGLDILQYMAKQPLYGSVVLNYSMYVQ